MKPVNHQHIPLNEQTTPLSGKPYYRSAGLIKAWAGDGTEYAVAVITLERFDEQNFQYIFTPIWSVIDALPANLFHGIPGLDLDLRLAAYYRVNMTPVFIADRTPGRNREDLWELMESVGLDYYDRFEWLLRTDLRYSSDNLIVRRLADSGQHYSLSDLRKFPEITRELTCHDTITLSSFQSFSDTSARQFSRDFMALLASGASLYFENEQRHLSDEERCAMLRLLILQKRLDQKQRRQKQEKGIVQAKEKGKYTGRKRIKVDACLMEEIDARLKAKEISVAEAMSRLGLRSRSTFYRRLREYRAGRKEK